MPGSEPSPASLRRVQVRRQRLAQPLGALGDLERGEAVHVDPGHRLLDRADDVDVELAVEGRVDAALQAHLGRAESHRLHGALGDVVEGEQVRRPPQVERQRPLAEAAERAPERAHVGVVDVAVDDVGDRVADGLAAQVVGHLGHRGDLGTAGPEQGDDLRLPDLLAGPDPVEHLADRPPRLAGSARSPRLARRSESARAGGCPRRSTRPSSGGRSARPRRRCRRWRRPGAARARWLPGRRGRGPRRRSGPAPGNGPPGRASGRARRRTTGGASAAAPARGRASSVTARRVRSAGQGRSGLTWSMVTGETPPQSSRPAPSRSPSRSGSERFGGAWTWTSGGSTSRARAIARTWSSGGHGAAARIAVPGLGRKFWTITSCTCPCRAWLAAIASSASTRSTSSSPMPTRMPVVKGIASSPAASRVASRRSGVLSGAPRWAARSGRSDSIIIPWDGATVRRRASSSRATAPAFMCGSRPVSASTRPPSRRGSRPSRRSRDRRASRAPRRTAPPGPRPA